MKVLLGILGTIVGVPLVIGLLFALTYGGQEWRRYFEPRNENISREVFEQNSVQFTNPEKFQIDRHFGNYHGYTLPQSDPNGLFMPTGLAATWLMMLDEKTGEVRPVYIEPEIIVSPFKLH